MSFLAPSVLSADFSNLKNDLRAVELGKADFIHCDIMDGQFVPNLTFGPMIVKAIKQSTTLPLDVHLMVNNPDHLFEDFVKAGADIITIHYEALIHHNRSIQKIKSFGIKAGVAINPSTPVHFLEELFEYVDLVLIMSVNPGFGGQKFIKSSLNKVKKIKDIKIQNNYNFLIEIDGGINKYNIKECVDNGVDIVVAGAAIFNDNITESTIELKRLIS